MTEASSRDGLRCAVIGYGAAFNQGRSHARQIVETPGLRLTAICDLDPARVEAAEADFPGIEGYTDAARLIADGVADLAAVVVPHRWHASTALACLRGGLHVVIEKPMAITIAECTELIEAARASGRALTVYHNRRWDGDFLTLRDLIRRGTIGEVFHIEHFMGGYGRPGGGWRADKATSGGAFYDWGAHFVDWTLGLMDAPMVSVTGFVHKRVWQDVTNEDQVQAVVRFRGGQVADLQTSSISLGPKPRWRILGTAGAILDRGDRIGRDQRPACLVRVPHAGYQAEFQVPYQEGVRGTFYPRLLAHIARGEPIPVTAESARRVIAVLDLAERSARSGQAEPVPYEDAFVGPHAP
jgi:scyllo-inositol 2-dehydrogenase (NADP+)